MISVHGEETALLGTPYTISFDAYDPGDDTVVRWRVDWDEGLSPGGAETVEEFGAGTRSAQHVYDEVGAKSIRVMAIDEDGETLGPVHSVRIVVDIAQVDAGGPYTVREGEDLVLHTSAPGAPSQHLVYSRQFTVFQPLLREPRTSDIVTIPWETLDNFYLRPNSEHILYYQVQYSDGQVGQDEFSLTVLNLPPVASLVVSPSSVDEGGEVEIVARASDPSQRNVLTYEFDIDNDGVYERVDRDGGTESRHTFTFPDNAEQVVIRVLVSDSIGGETEVFGVLTVNEVAPILNVEPVSGAYTATEGADFSLRLGATDPGDDTISHWVVDWGDGGPRTTHEGAAPTVVHRFRESGPVVIRLWAYDEDGAYHVSQSMTVANAAPTLAGVTVTPATEGAATRLSGRFSDPGVEESFEALVDWGDGRGETLRLDGDADEFGFNHVYARDGTYTIVIILRDADGAEDSAQAEVVVANAVPEISLNAERSVIQEGMVVTVFGTVSDLGSHDTHTVRIDWGEELITVPALLEPWGGGTNAGEGTVTPAALLDPSASGNAPGEGTDPSIVVVDPSTGYYTATHVYRDDAGSPFTITATVTDSDGATSQASVDLRVENVAPVFQYFYVSGVDDVDFVQPRVNIVWDDAEFTTDISAVDTVTVTGSYSDYDADVGIVRVRWGDDEITAAVLDEDTQTFTATHTYDGDASDFVDDIALLMSTPQPRLDEGSRIAVTGRVQDVGADLVALRIDWGDDAAEDYEVDPATGEFTAEHTYSADQGTAGFYHITAVATDDDGGAHSARLPVPVERAPVFSQERYAFDLSENRDGSETPVELDFVAATDVNHGDEIIYSISSHPSAFAIDPASGMLRYVGPGEDFETAPYSYELTVQATDLTGRSDSTTVVVSIADENDAAAIGGDLAGSVTEDAAETAARGRLTVNDPDAGEDSFAAKTGSGTYGTFALAEDGTWSYQLDNGNPDTDALAAGQTATDSFAVASADGTAAEVTVTVTGANDAAGGDRRRPDRGDGDRGRGEDRVRGGDGAYGTFSADGSDRDNDPDTGAEDGDRQLR